MKNNEYIEIIGARAHNLKGASLSIPRGKFVVLTGLSGSGKSSLAFDTIYAEGQRRYMDTLSTYAKHFMGILEKPEVESITGLSPIIAIEQKTTGNNPRSTVGTITEIYDFLRLLYARASTAYSPQTGKAMVRYTDEQIVSLIMDNYAGRKCYLLAPIVKGRKGHYKELLEQMRKRGYTQARIDGDICELSEITALDRYKAHFVELVIDRLKPSEKDTKRIKDSVMSALNIGKGSLAVMDMESGEMNHYSKHLVCPDTGISLAEPAPHSFSFNSPQGYCPHCKGLGIIVDVNMDTIIPDRSVSIADGGIVPLGKIRETKKFDVIRSIARKYAFSLYDPIEELPEEMVTLLVFGSDELFRVGEGSSSEMVSYDGYTKEGTNLEIHVSSESDSEQYVELPLLMYPGYQALAADTKHKLAVTYGDNNVVRVMIPAGFEGIVKVSFAGKWYWTVAEILSVLTLCGLVLIPILRKRQGR